MVKKYCFFLKKISINLVKNMGQLNKIIIMQIKLKEYLITFCEDNNLSIF